MFIYSVICNHVKYVRGIIAINRLPVACFSVARFSSDSNAIRYVLPVFWMTSCFYIIERIGSIRDDPHVSLILPGGGTGAKSAVYDCILLINCQHSSFVTFYNRNYNRIVCSSYFNLVFS